MTDAGDDKAHNESNEYKPKHIPEQVQQSHKYGPDKVNPVYPDEFRNIKSHAFFPHFAALFDFIKVNLSRCW